MENNKELSEEEKYDDYHTHNDYVVDSKGRKHTSYIYQDYRKVDGYYVDDGFDANEIMYREDFDYYKDTERNLLIRKEKNTNKYYIYTVGINSDNDEAFKEWFLPDDYYPDLKDVVMNYDFSKLIEVKDYKEIIEFIDKEYYDAENAYRDQISGKTKMEDITLNLDMRNDKHVWLYGSITDGALHITSEVSDDDFSSEKHYVFTVEQTNKLFAIISVTEFEESCKKGGTRWLEDFLDKCNIHPKTTCI